MRNVIFTCLVLLCFTVGVKAQQDAMLTKYMFNSLTFNPAFAGSPEYLSARILHRSQWWGLDGGPVTQVASVHAPASERVGLGLGLINDQIGATGSSSANMSYAYRVPFGKGKVSMGLQTGATNWRADWDKLRFRDPASIDPSFSEMNPSYWMFNVGAGVFYYTPDYYIGFSVPHLINNDLRRDVPDGQDVWAQQYRHYYFTAGAALPLNKSESLIFKPSILIKTVGLFGDFTPASSNPSQVGAPTEFDIDLSVLFYNTLWVGGSVRGAFEAKVFGGDSSFDSADVWMAYYLQGGYRIGAAYDYTISNLNDFVGGSFEVMLGYDMSFSTKRFNTPRYF